MARKRQVGDKVSLNVGSSYGALNSLALLQDGWKREPVEIVEINAAASNSYRYRVKLSDLPQGERWIDERDIKA